MLGEAAAVAPDALLTVFPALAVLIWLCGILLEPDAAVQGLQDAASGSLPAAAAEVAGELLNRLAAFRERGFAWGTPAAVIPAALWGAIVASDKLFSALNVAYDERESRGLLRLYAVALVFSLSAAVFILLALGAILVPAALADRAGTGGILDGLLLGRWPLLFAAVSFGPALTYRHGLSRKCARWQWVSWGGALAALAWLLSSAALFFYVARSRGYDRLYGSLGAVVVLMVWAWLSSATVLIGAALNAELERHSAGSA
ncbi:YihY/virulence factor BrkB family protein [Muricoccus aerilatus]|uniref:YihY/virulence factor BrkB family protein n=1 Tax=Muricoccus aerilatus TaxID=452982 RepID=UPI000694E6A1|nr:YhjD/YihY/BrkB family envelope integrity protein [Roseomonas aerilata]